MQTEEARRQLPPAEHVLMPPRRVQLPDPTRVERCLRLPELGPKVLFFSGGTALRDISTRLKCYTHNSIHLITPFDSGGSSAIIRASFDCLAIGDLRNRLVALAEESLFGTPEIVTLAEFRLDQSKTQSALRKELVSMVNGSHPLVNAVPCPIRQIVCSHLHWFARAISKSTASPRAQAFDLRGASIGNLLLVGGYLASASQRRCIAGTRAAT